MCDQLRTCIAKFIHHRSLALVEPDVYLLCQHRLLLLLLSDCISLVERKRVHTSLELSRV